MKAERQIEIDEEVYELAGCKKTDAMIKILRQKLSCQQILVTRLS